MSALDQIADTAITEHVAASAFAEQYRGQWAYDHSRGKWYEFDDIWRVDEVEKIKNVIRMFCISLRAKNQAAVEKTRFVDGVEKFARADPIFRRSQKYWNQNKFLLGTPGGTVDLTTGRLRPSSAADGITRSTATPPTPGEDCPLWLDFLDQATRSDPDLIRFLKQIAGYCLTGDTTEQALFFLYGPGGNGKGVFIGVMQAILADYAVNAGMEMLERQKFTGHSTELARLAGARMVSASETEEGGEWNEKRVKAMTGQDRITARFMAQDNFEYDPEFKLLIAGNHEPALRSVDEAMRRRFNIIPFTNAPRVKDHDLPKKLVAEYPGILRWMINGCLDWLTHRLIRPAVVLKATSDYFADQNTMQQWIDQECVVEINNPWCQEKSSLLFSSWVTFAKKNGLKPGDSRTFKPAMIRLGFEQKATKTANFWAGIKLKFNPEDG